jgi:hypothetical protein
MCAFEVELRQAINDLNQVPAYELSEHVRYEDGSQRSQRTRQLSQLITCQRRSWNCLACAHGPARLVLFAPVWPGVSVKSAWLCGSAVLFRPERAWLCQGCAPRASREPALPQPATGSPADRPAQRGQRP